MVQHVMEYHMMQSVEKTNMLEQNVAKLYTENQQLRVTVATQEQGIKKLEERVQAMEKSIAFGADLMPDRKSVV